LQQVCMKKYIYSFALGFINRHFSPQSAKLKEKSLEKIFSPVIFCPCLFLFGMPPRIFHIFQLLIFFTNGFLSKYFFHIFLTLKIFFLFIYGSIVIIELFLEVFIIWWKIFLCVIFFHIINNLTTRIFNGKFNLIKISFIRRHFAGHWKCWGNLELTDFSRISSTSWDLIYFLLQVNTNVITIFFCFW
jgi:hypothetical protein